MSNKAASYVLRGCGLEYAAEVQLTMCNSTCIYELLARRFSMSINSIQLICRVVEVPEASDFIV